MFVELDVRCKELAQTRRRTRSRGIGIIIIRQVVTTERQAQCSLTSFISTKSIAVNDCTGPLISRAHFTSLRLRSVNTPTAGTRWH